MTICHDSNERAACLDISKSWIIQAPAGSGKTELLTQRFLKLLSCVPQPETIIAITFTKKAASEMRERILKALIRARDEDKPLLPHEATTWTLAKAALSQSTKREWHLLESPNRLRIMTLDALSLMLSTHLPITSGFGAIPSISDKPNALYEQAVSDFLNKQHEEPLHGAIDQLLLHLDNQAPLLQNLLIQLLSKREQWLHHIIPHHTDTTLLKQSLEHALEQVATEHLSEICQLIPADTIAQYESILHYSLESRKITLPCTASLTCAPSQVPAWQALTEILFTKNQSIRKKLTKKEGFPGKTGVKEPEKSIRIAYKEQAMQLLCELEEKEVWHNALLTLVYLPPVVFEHNRWSALNHLVTALPWVMAELLCLFQKTGEVDFNELTLGALRAMGDEDNPTDLAMKLDYQINHMLIDEFQDTSLLQGRLLKQLVAHWTKEDKKTLFIVGDPMQSIYRFRNAAVGLFLQAQKYGLGPVYLHQAALSTNFRSSPNIVDWVNRQFSKIFPSQETQTYHSIPYNHSHSAKEKTDSESGVFFLPASAELLTEAAIIRDQISSLRANHPNDSIAILVRTRSQLKELIALLRGSRIPIEATDIDLLSRKPEIIDCLILTKALLHLGDRQAWFALFLTPVFGFHLDDCIEIADKSKNKSIVDLLMDPSALTCRDETKGRLSILQPILKQALSYINRGGLSDWIYQIWQAIGFAETLQKTESMSQVKRFFQCLAQHEEQFNWDHFEQSIQSLFAESAPADEQPVQIMTIHKSKGLEFDHVILPNINRGRGVSDTPLLQWATPAFSDGSSGLLLAAQPSKRSACRVFDYLRHLEKKQNTQELSRLFYVACTRAKQSLYLSTVFAQTEKAQSDSFLEKLPEVLHPKLTDFDKKEIENNTEITNQPAKQHARLTQAAFLSTQRPPIPTHIADNDTVALQLSLNEQIIGTVTHKYLEMLSKPVSALWPDEQLNIELLSAGLPKRHIKHACNDIQSAIKRILQDKHGQFLLSNDHPTALSEWRISERKGKTVKQHIIDRYIIDSEGTHWIIDYKTSRPSTASIESFLESESKKYKAQLSRYSRCLEHPGRMIRCALYFTSLPKLFMMTCNENKTEVTDLSVS